MRTIPMTRNITFAQRVHRILFPLKRRRLKRNIRGWISPAIKNGRNSVEAEFVAEWSFELSHYFGA